MFYKRVGTSLSMRSFGWNLFHVKNKIVRYTLVKSKDKTDNIVLCVMGALQKLKLKKPSNRSIGLKD